MELLKFSIITLFTFFALGNVNVQKLKAFGSSIEKKIRPVSKRVPYTDIVSYLGHAAPNSEDEVKDDKKFYYIFV